MTPKICISGDILPLHIQFSSFCKFKHSQHEPDPQQNDKSTSTGKGKAAFHVKSEEKELDVVDDDLIAKGLL